MYGSSGEDKVLFTGESFAIFMELHESKGNFLKKGTMKSFQAVAMNLDITVRREKSLSKRINQSENVSKLFCNLSFTVFLSERLKT